MVKNSRSDNELKSIKKELRELVVCAEKKAQSLTKKESALYLYMSTLSTQMREILQLKLYPTLACVARLTTLVKGCNEEELKTEVMDFCKIIATHKERARDNDAGQMNE